jgi:uncharacterized protein YndB with AHSA1/START domain
VYSSKEAGLVNQALVERELRLTAGPEKVFGLLTDPVQVVGWMGREATFDVRPGGVFQVRYNDEDVVRGEFVEVVENARVVVTWGWEAAGAATPPGGSQVEFVLTPDGDETVLRLLHRGLVGDEVRSHGEGWDYFLPRLKAAAEG